MDRIAHTVGGLPEPARNRAVDLVRRSRRGRELTEKIASDRLRGQSTPDPETSDVMRDQLRLVFTCCHPSLRVEHQVALTLHLIAGLTPAEVASAFLVSEETMAKRLVCAKYKIKAARIPCRVPDDTRLPDRLRAALSVLYLVITLHAGVATAPLGWQCEQNRSTVICPSCHRRTTRPRDRPVLVGVDPLCRGVAAGRVAETPAVPFSSPGRSYRCSHRCSPPPPMSAPRR
ncbi:hypothetical protein OHA10_37070 [Kribbella sp. NBC_00662]|uniref:hypothetical protein n=1 Tax=Kribbella sp. NBC_00662 TaxID=2975969 RepID=UPI00324C50F4